MRTVSIKYVYKAGAAVYGAMLLVFKTLSMLVFNFLNSSANCSLNELKLFRPLKWITLLKLAVCVTAIENAFVFILFNLVGTAITTPAGAKLN